MLHSRVFTLTHVYPLAYLSSRLFTFARVYNQACLHSRMLTLRVLLSRLFILTALLTPSMIAKMPGYRSWSSQYKFITSSKLLKVLDIISYFCFSCAEQNILWFYLNARIWVSEIDGNNSLSHAGMHSLARTHAQSHTRTSWFISYKVDIKSLLSDATNHHFPWE